MKVAIIDAETNGLPDYKKPADDPSQPRLAALGVILCVVSDDKKTIKVEAEHEFLVKPAGWKMTKDAGAVNGLTDERLEAEGKPITEVLAFYAALVEDGYVVVAYGAQHDCKIMRGEFRRAGLDDHFEATKNVCLMRAVQPLRIPKANGKGGWPQLDDVLRHLGQKPEPRPHSALVGARCAFAVFSAFLPKGLLPAPTVHHAKNAPMGKEAAPAAQPAKAKPSVAIEPAPEAPVGREGQPPETAADIPPEDPK